MFVKSWRVSFVEPEIWMAWIIRFYSDSLQVQFKLTVLYCCYIVKWENIWVFPICFWETRRDCINLNIVNCAYKCFVFFCWPICVIYGIVEECTWMFAPYCQSNFFNGDLTAEDNEDNEYLVLISNYISVVSFGSQNFAPVWCCQRETTICIISCTSLLQGLMSAIDREWYRSVLSNMMLKGHVSTKYQRNRYASFGK